MSNYNRKYCNLCLHKFSPRTFDIHRTICDARRRKQTISVPCLYCAKINDGLYGSGAYCSKQCMYLDRKRYNKTCVKCELTITINNYNAHVASCQGLKFSTEIWKISDNKYECPICKLHFPQMGIGSHYKKIHGDFPKVKSFITKPKPIKRETNCIICKLKLSGKQKRFCSNKCKYQKYGAASNYQAQRRRMIRRKFILVSEAGGKCQKCGYNKNIASLCFHHTDESKKEFTLDARTLSGLGMTTIRKEAKKCELLCHNCHNEHHNPDLTITNITNSFSWAIA